MSTKIEMISIPIAEYERLMSAAGENKLLRGAMEAQDERERLAGEACGVPWTEHDCDWPQWVAEECKRLEALWIAAEADSAVKGTTIYNLRADLAAATAREQRMREALNAGVSAFDMPRTSYSAVEWNAIEVMRAALATPAPREAEPGTDWRKLAMDLYTAHGQPGLDAVSNAIRAIRDAVRAEREREKETQS